MSEYSGSRATPHYFPENDSGDPIRGSSTQSQLQSRIDSTHLLLDRAEKQVARLQELLAPVLKQGSGEKRGPSDAETVESPLGHSMLEVNNHTNRLLDMLLDLSDRIDL